MLEVGIVESVESKGEAYTLESILGESFEGKVVSSRGASDPEDGV